MSEFFIELFNSIFTPGPSPSIIIATNLSFAALQIVLFGLLIVTYSLHFVALSVLCAALWLSINWFVNELQTADLTKTNTKQTSSPRKAERYGDSGDSATETENASTQSETSDARRITADLLTPPDSRTNLRKRKNSGEASSGELSADSDWDKVSEADGVGR